MNSASTMGEFLRARRSGLSPDVVSLPSIGGRRRVSGLRREEIAQLAGVSVDYYTRMEQGRVANPSDAVLDALARALRLDAEETRHLHRLARPQSSARRTARRRTVPQTVRPMLRRLLDELVDVPAVIRGRRMDVLAWNDAACALFGDFAELDPADRNIARMTFLNPESRRLYADWTACARENVAYLHMEAGLHPDDPQLAGLIGELSMKSEDFRRWWAQHPVQDGTSGIKRFHHPVAGELTLEYETLRAAGDPSQALLMYAAEPGSPSHDALRLLLAWAVPEAACAPEASSRSGFDTRRAEEL
ncbi:MULTISPECIES: helix-turn-helix transcriptional regulator [Actinoalloteichus]|uniref:Transcriptional regulator n=1 Tax=Actinoalloteichus fjordicus TaxID=1612552 RepID=A0AAC9LDW0_9PSEU|nr:MULTISPECIES: helix-turn-helix transcriptional regulator [Actinoalloteichus]APU15069.1 putative transcriptional regulator [Actinoalloteichus fjordicus]APU21137.1 putative transcriptional regulator [Actinoalloteichus sp. GBA129-24]